ncbi:MAG: hypothetical protein R6V53_02850 [Candidatus Woesearchaeota archaeon]
MTDVSMYYVQLAKDQKERFQANPEDRMDAILMIQRNYCYDNIQNNRCPYSIDELTDLLHGTKQKNPENHDFLDFAIAYANAYEPMSHIFGYITDTTAESFANGVCEQLRLVPNAVLQIENLGQSQVQIGITGKMSAFLNWETDPTACEYAKKTIYYGQLCEDYLQRFK